MKGVFAWKFYHIEHLELSSRRLMPGGSMRWSFRRLFPGGSFALTVPYIALRMNQVRVLSASSILTPVIMFSLLHLMSWPPDTPMEGRRSAERQFR